MTQEEITLQAINGQRFSIETAMMYHERRVLFWEVLAFIARVFEFFTTSAAAVFLFQDQTLETTRWMVLAAALFAFLVIALDAQRRIKHNARQRARMGELRLRVPHNLATVTEAQLEEIVRDRKRIELDDGVLLECFAMICHNRQCMAEGNPDGKVPINWWEWSVGRFFPVPYRS